MAHSKLSLPHKLWRAGSFGLYDLFVGSASTVLAQGWLLAATSNYVQGQLLAVTSNYVHF